MRFEILNEALWGLMEKPKFFLLLGREKRLSYEFP
jgi:hypothetical protein